MQSGKRSRFNHLTHAISFFDRCLGRQTDADTMDELAEADAADSAGGAAICSLHSVDEDCSGHGSSEGGTMSVHYLCETYQKILIASQALAS